MIARESLSSGGGYGVGCFNLGVMIDNENGKLQEYNSALTLLTCCHQI